MNIFDFLKIFAVDSLSDIIGGFIVWVVKGCKKNNLKNEVIHKGWRNEAVFYLLLLILIIIFFLIIVLFV